MQDQPITKKQCENCAYFSQHFSKGNSRYDTVCCGHCINKKNKKMILLGICDNWENIAIKKEERKKHIKEILISMAERLDEIAMLLEDDKSI